MIKPDELLDACFRYGFQQAYFCDPSTTTGVPSGVNTLLLLLKAYSPWESEIDYFYVSDNAAYHNANKIIQELSYKGENAILLPFANYKLLCSAIPPFQQGRNSLHYHHSYGSRFCLQLIGLSSIYSYSYLPSGSKGMCGSCKLCTEACPTNAIKESGFQRESCLRSYMLSGKPIPLKYRYAMGERLLGCDICQRVCPYNQEFQSVKCNYHFPIGKLLPPDKNEIAFYANLLGANYSNANRICAQAALVAGNRKDKSLLSQLETLMTSRSEVVRAHSTWAVEQIISSYE